MISLFKAFLKAMTPKTRENAQKIKALLDERFTSTSPLTRVIF